MSIENRVNGILIGFGYVVNETFIDEENCLYSVEYHRVGKKPNVVNLSVIHKREEGAEKLSLLIYSELDKILKKKKQKNKENEN